MLAEWLFRPQCAACAIPSDAPLCGSCARSLVEVDNACPRCADVESEGALCRRCLTTPLPLDRIVVPWRFGGALAIAIKRLKFARAVHVARTVAPLWSAALAATVHAYDAIVVPVPLHWRRRWSRGFDQAWFLARHACSDAGLAAPVHALMRHRPASPQSRLDALERQANLAGAFAMREVATVAGRAVVLVDDVVTTGSTLAAAAHTLLAAGATTVVGVALARA